ncbi:MAG: histidyl-tRNA synthetase [bacterium]|nr:MAG: histidyl-tRNA synthetase [bacterium]
MTEDAAAPARPEARNPRGFADRRGRDLIAERRLVQRVSEVYERWGFEPLETGAFEYADALGKFLPDADRPNEGVFALQDDDEQWMALRYDLTAPLARFAAQGWETLPKPFRRYAFGPVWRNEKPGPGRFREFVQCDADTVGSDRPEADAEIIAMACEGLRAAGLDAGQAVVRVSNRKLFDGLFQAGGIEDAGQKLTALRAIDKFDRLGWEGVAALLGEGRLDESGDYTKGARLPSGVITTIEGFLSSVADEGLTRAGTLDAVARVGGLGEIGEAALAELAAIDAALNAMKVSQDAVRFDPTIVRGLEYYTGAVFEAGAVHRRAPAGDRLLVRGVAPGLGPARGRTRGRGRGARTGRGHRLLRQRHAALPRCRLRAAQCGDRRRAVSGSSGYEGADEIRRPARRARRRHPGRGRDRGRTGHGEGSGCGPRPRRRRQRQ